MGGKVTFREDANASLQGSLWRVRDLAIPGYAFIAPLFTERERQRLIGLWTATREMYGSGSTTRARVYLATVAASNLVVAAGIKFGLEALIS